MAMPHSPATVRTFEGAGWPQRLLAALAVVVALVVILPAPNAQAQGKWTDTATELISQLDAARSTYSSGDAEGAAQQVREIRARYTSSGLQAALSAKSGSAASDIDLDFAMLIKSVKESDDEAVNGKIDELGKLLENAGHELDGGATSLSDLQVSPGKWGQIASTMNDLLTKALDAYKSGDAEGGKKLVNSAYYDHYETTGFEKVTMSRVSGGRVATVELQFSLVKQAMTEGSDDRVTSLTEELQVMLIQDANNLDGFDPNTGETSEQTGSVALFLSSLLVILREGLEAILVVSAVIAFLVKAGHGAKTRVVWLGVSLALLLSVALAFVFRLVADAAGANQELLEGITALIAVAMLVWVSNWMLGKSSQSAWDKYLKDKTADSLSRGSLASLAFVSFLAVLREGAETILFYQPILAMADNRTGMVWAGLGVGAVILVGVYIGIRFFALRIPLRPFFIVTSLLLAAMAVMFTGSGIKELQEADAVSSTPITGLPTIDLLSIYPRAENLIAQGVVLLVICALFWLGRRRVVATTDDEQ